MYVTALANTTVGFGFSYAHGTSITSAKEPGNALHNRSLGGGMLSWQKAGTSLSEAWVWRLALLLTRSVGW